MRTPSSVPLLAALVVLAGAAPISTMKAQASAPPPTTYRRTDPLPPRAAIARDTEMHMARAAAPAAVSGQATIWVAGARGYDIAAKGTNGWGCFVQRNAAGSSGFPRCDDAERVAALYPVYLLLEEYRAQGKTAAEYDAAVAAGYKSGKYRAPAVGALSYMLADGLIKPHVMVSVPGCEATQLGLASEEQMADTTLTTIFRGLRDKDCDMVIWTGPHTAIHHGGAAGRPR